MKRIFVLWIALLSVAAWAQTATVPVKTPSFDVVSIRENKDPNIPREFGSTANGYHGRNVSPLLLLLTSFVPSNGKTSMYSRDVIDGMPDWMLQSHYDVEAKVADQDIAAWKQPEVQRAMLQQVLTDRFKLVTHREQREKPAYDLVVAKGGPKFKASETTDLGTIQKKYPAARAMPDGMILVHGPGPQQTMLIDATMADLCFTMGGAGRPVEDKTGLTGRYDLSLTLDISPGPDGAPPDPMNVMITALQEQLGLKLEPAKENVEILVIDHVERPSEN